MLTTILAMALGFSAALFLVLLVAPAVAGRVSDLTWRQAERVLPQSMEEIAAERDRMRGEFAVATRKLEMQLEDVTLRHNADRVQLVRKDDRIAVLDADVAQLKSDLAGRDASIDALRATLREAEENQLALRTQIADLSVRLSSEEAAVESLTAQKAALEAERARLGAELAALDAKSKRTLDANGALREKLDTTDRLYRATRADLKLAETQNKQFLRKLDGLEAKLNKAMADQADAEVRAQRIKQGDRKPAEARLLAAANESQPDKAAPRPRATPPDEAIPADPARVDGAVQLRRQAKAFRAALPQVTQDEAAARRLAGPLTEIAAAAVRQAVRQAAPDSKLAKLASAPGLNDTPLGRAITQRTGPARKAQPSGQ
ncbi:MAG: hypothetical protein MUC58_02055 [Rhizobiaceae bacterium]|nr:hypothetical protein [Rhizobiaceae bacterium]